MAKFRFTETVPQGTVLAAKLGADSDNPLSDADVGKAVKLDASDNYVLADAGDEIEGFLLSVEPATQDGFSFGSVQKGGRKAITIDGTLAVGDLVVVGTVVARGIALTGPVKVKKGTAASQLATGTYAYTERTPNTHLWRLIDKNDTVGVIEKI
jgi:hypothetical protein